MDEITNKTSLAGQVALITGAGRGIGAAIAAKIARMGATVVLAGRTRGPLESTADAIVKAGGQAEAVVCDVMHFSSVEPLAAPSAVVLGDLGHEMAAAFRRGGQQVPAGLSKFVAT